MNRVLLRQSVRDSWLLLAACCALTAAFIWLRIWIASKIRTEAFIRMFSGALKMFASLLPVPIEDLASPLGRSAFSYEEMPVILLLGLWTVARGSECIAGRVGAGTMEMLLAQPLRRFTLVASHSTVTFAGVAVLGIASWLGLGAGLATSSFPAPPALRQLLPATANYVAFGLFLAALATAASAVFRTRSQAVAAVIAFYVVNLAAMILSRLSPSAEWLQNFTVFSTYEPTMLAINLARDAEHAWPLFWQYNAVLVGLGAALWGAAATIFCRRDVPAPL
jgi:ABC-type transport system involved in multi-copper enzyme maturation permease subunit